MKKVLISLVVVLISSVSFAGQGEGSCQSYAEKVAMNLFSLENSASDLDNTSVKVRLLNTASASNQTQWQVSFSQDEGENEWSVIYSVETNNIGDTQKENCILDYVNVQRAG